MSNYIETTVSHLGHWVSVFDKRRTSAVLTCLCLQQRQAAQQHGRRCTFSQQGMLGVLSSGLFYCL